MGKSHTSQYVNFGSLPITFILNYNSNQDNNQFFNFLQQLYIHLEVIKYLIHFPKNTAILESQNHNLQ